ncbi:MAG: DUF2269 family protein [Dehalococcoidia bacterium]
MNTGDEFLLFLHVLASFWYVAGLTAVQFALVRGWQAREVEIKLEAYDEASHYQGALLVPGGIAVVSTGLFFWGGLGYNLLSPAWLILLDLVYVVTLVVCLPLIGIGMRRARIAALQTVRLGRSTPELDEAMSDPVPLMFGGFAAMLIPAAVALSVFRPF